jgi:hypothetical protein
MGNLGCGCDHINKEEIVFDSLQIPPNKLLGCINNPCKTVSDNTQTEPTENLRFEIQGELFRVQKSAKEYLVPRWCVLNMNTFKYFKNQFAAVCGESPLFEIPVKKIICGRVYEKEEQFCIELNFFKESATVGVCKERKPLGEIKEFNAQSANENISENRIEIVVFVLSNKVEWTKWSRGLLSCIKFNL